jgi:nitrous oxidase accessory protein
MRLLALLTALLLVAITLPGAGPAQAAEQANRLIVSPNGPYTTIDAALRDARDGDTIEVRGGVHGPLVVETAAVTLEGVDWPVIDGGDQGTVVTLAAPGIVFRGFEVRGSGVEPDRDHAGITLSAPRITIENNRLSDVLFGVFVAQADDAIVRGNDITGKVEYDLGRKGDGIRVWYSSRAVIENNHVHETRDVVIWYSPDTVIRGNTIEDGRYGVHLMYCDRAQVEGNRLLNNSVGVYAMYSDGAILRDNLVRGQRGPSGYALGFKDADNIEVSGNVLVDNRVGIFLDGAPFNAGGMARHAGNILAFNDVGVVLLPAVRGNVFEDNTFWENVEQVAVQGGGVMRGNDWQGNFWSDDSGFDADGDGLNDMPYHAERFFESLTDREPRLQALIYSPAAQAIETAAAAFPIVRPQPKLIDPAPRTQPADIPVFALVSSGSAAPMIFAAILMIGLGAVCSSIAFINSRIRRSSIRSGDFSHPRTEPTEIATTGVIAMTTPENDTTTLLALSAVAKHYGQVVALDGVSFEAGCGEAIALWGPNGAGKTTLLKAILGLIDFKGDIRVAGRCVRREGKRARSHLGYVPQESIFYDWRVRETMAFYARLKKVDSARIPVLLERLGLTEHAAKSVSALSGGLRQRLALAVALLADPPLLLLDEPTANLDARTRREYLALLAALRREGKTIVFASHRFEELEALADRVLLLERGRIVETLTPEALRSSRLSTLELTLWVPDNQRAGALGHLESAGLNAHLNGRGTVVVEVAEAQKMKPMHILNAQGIPVLNFELERVQAWN